MKLLDRLVLRELFPAFRMGVVMFTVLVFAGVQISEVSKYLTLGVPPRMILTFLALKLPWVLGLTFPMGTLLAMLIGYGRLSADSEAVALFAGGIPFGRIAAPAAALGLGASLVGFVINDRIAADANRRIAGLQQQVLHEPPNVTGAINWEQRQDGVLMAMVHVERGFELRTKTMRQIVITLYDGRHSAPIALVYADRGQWLGGVEWRLFDVFVLHPGENAPAVHVNELNPRTFSSALEKTPDEIAFLGSHLDMFDFHQLARRIAGLKAKGAGGTPQVREAEVELWSKLALPLASVVFALIGAPLGLQPQRASGHRGWLLAVGIIFGYYVLYMMMRSLATGGYCPASVAVFLPNTVGLLGGLFLVKKVSGSW